MLEEFIINEQLYRCKFNQINFFSPYHIGTELELDDSNYRNSLDLDYIYSELNNINQREKKDKYYNWLIVIDDLIAEFNKLGNDPRL